MRTFVHVVLEHTDHEGDNLLGVFSDHGKARNFSKDYTPSLSYNYLLCHLLELDAPRGTMSDVGEPLPFIKR